MDNAKDEREIQEFIREFPFLTILECNALECIGIVLNKATSQVSMYVYDELKSDSLKRKFIELGDRWWWQTNRQIPIGIIYRNEVDPFNHCLRKFPTRNSSFLAGPQTSLSGLNRKRTKRRNIHLNVRK